MLTPFYAIILGIIEGLTEFLPVSSTGHLILSSYFLGISSELVDTFEVIIQLGAILAVIVLYFPRFWGLIFPKVQKQKFIDRFCGWRGIWMLFLTSLPAGLVGLFFHKYIKGYLFNPYSVSLALFAGALAMLIVDRKTSEKNISRRIKYGSIDDLGPAQALGIGFFQCLSLWPGFSRSASTIMGGLILGATRKTAAEYSFIAAVPIMFAATFYELYSSSSLWAQSEALYALILGFVVSFLAALLAIKGFTALLTKVGLAPFAWYRIIIAILVWYFWVN